MQGENTDERYASDCSFIQSHLQHTFVGCFFQVGTEICQRTSQGSIFVKGQPTLLLSLAQMQLCLTDKSQLKQLFMGALIKFPTKKMDDFLDSPVFNDTGNKSIAA